MLGDFFSCVQALVLENSFFLGGGGYLCWWEVPHKVSQVACNCLGHMVIK